jgi:PAS domain-containing protein
MSRTDVTQVLPPARQTLSDPRVHLLDDTWLLTIFATLLATAVPWMLSGFDVDFVAVALGLLGLGAIHIAFTLLRQPVHSGERRPLLTTLHVVGILIVGFVWMHAGGLQNPAFLMVFALPVVGSIFLSRWRPYLMALLAVLVVGAVALVQSPELRWYAPGLSTIGTWLARLFDDSAAMTSGPFRGFYAPSGYFVVLLQVFSILVFACALAAEYLGTIFERLHARADVAQAEAKRGQAFWTALIEQLPVPAFLVDADTLRIVCASEQAGVLCHVPPTTGSAFFATIRFSYPDVVQQLITESGGTTPLSMVRVGDRLRATEVQVQHLVQDQRRFALIVIMNKSDEFTTSAALDMSGQAALVIDGKGRVLTFNKPAAALFPGIERDADASRLLSLTGMSTRWWEPGLTGRRKMHVEIAPRIYQVASSAWPLPGEEEHWFIVTFQPVARTAVGENTAITATVQIAEAANATVSNPTVVSQR